MYQYGNLGKGTQVRIPWTTLTFFLNFIFSPHDIGTLDRAPKSTFIFSSFSLETLSLGLGVVGSNNHSPFYFPIYFPCLFRINQEVMGSNPHNLSLFFFYLFGIDRLWGRTPTASLF